VQEGAKKRKQLFFASLCALVPPRGMRLFIFSQLLPPWAIPLCGNARPGGLSGTSGGLVNAHGPTAWVRKFTLFPGSQALKGRDKSTGRAQVAVRVSPPMLFRPFRAYRQEKDRFSDPGRWPISANLSCLGLKCPGNFPEPRLNEAASAADASRDNIWQGNCDVADLQLRSNIAPIRNTIPIQYPISNCPAKKRLPSNGFIESAQDHRVQVRFLRGCALPIKH
jgi:hypothetical protein